MDDVELIMSQTKCSRDMAISALRKNNNDLVQSIMELSGCFIPVQQAIVILRAQAKTFSFKRLLILL
ncbi:hypothetical protein PFUGPA_00649 [Plasmodium falciparum Palo Alto/Uganda]|uniref:Nascent polypeptide-associated complex subunit alpha-like UBA domain-containing protein n=1 Tax=Plasmodium falciparum (isolate Palo Alto / Uganda) TaxID=57270 RepID=W4J6W0_PLAFP|nr:hypothetical protein PFUGPA_00649 [Plasmodium falciparum Palo Alto/Uganda]